MSIKEAHQDKFDAQPGEHSIKIDQLKAKADKTKSSITSRCIQIKAVGITKPYILMACI